MPRQRKGQELRCFCRYKPLLATYGRGSDGLLYVHIKVFKQDRIYGEVVVTGGVVKLLCRDCLRWHKVRIMQPDQAELIEDRDPHYLP